MTHWGVRFVTGALVALVVVEIAAGTAASAGECGGAVPCSCGDSVIASRRLVRGVDPVTTTRCPGDGLIITGDVVLDLGGATIQGSLAPGSVGVFIATEHGEPVVKRGTVAGFGTGISGQPGESVTPHIERVNLVGNAGAGIEFQDADVRHVTARGNGGHGIDAGCGRIRDSHADRNGQSGIVIRFLSSVSFFCPSSVTHALSTRNGGAGFSLVGDGRVTIERTLAVRNGGSGYEVFANPGVIAHSQAFHNGEHGFAVGGFGSELSHVRTKGNRGFGIHDAAMSSVYGPGNYCQGDDLGDSSPPDLCQ
jgi:hypothetical protein